MFREVLPEICAELGIKCTSLSDDWVHLLTYQGKKHFIIGSHSDLNSSASATIADDKTATYAVLKNAKIPAVPHFLISNEGYFQNHPFTDLDLLKKSFVSFPLVIKPNRGTFGRSVTLVHNQDDAIKAALEIIAAEGSVCYSPFYESQYEYRSFFLDGKILYIYRKIRPEGSWRHNLSGGAKPELLSPDSKLYKSIEKLALAAGKAIGLRFATVDILDTKDGLKVLEVNQGVCAGIFARSLPNGQEIAKDIFRQALAKLFDISL